MPNTAMPATPTPSAAYETGRSLARDFGIRVLHQLDQRLGPLGLRVARQNRGHQLAHRRALVARHAGELVQADELNHALRIERGATAQALLHDPWSSVTTSYGPNLP